MDASSLEFEILVGQASVFRFGGFELVSSTRELLGPVGPIDLQPRVFDLLLYLVLQRDRVVPHRELFRALWPGVAVTEDSLTYAVMAARRALGDAGSKQWFIKTSRKCGYRFVATVEENSERVPIQARAPAEVIRCPWCSRPHMASLR